MSCLRACPWEGELCKKLDQTCIFVTFFLRHVFARSLSAFNADTRVNGIIVMVSVARWRKPGRADLPAFAFLCIAGRGIRVKTTQAAGFEEMSARVSHRRGHAAGQVAQSADQSAPQRIRYFSRDSFKNLYSHGARDSTLTRRPMLPPRHIEPPWPVGYAGDVARSISRHGVAAQVGSRADSVSSTPPATQCQLSSCHQYLNSQPSLASLASGERERAPTMYCRSGPPTCDIS